MVWNQYKNQKLLGPTGQEYPVSDATFRSSFPNYLQSYEFYTLANTIFNIHGIEFELIVHLHDGLVVALPKEKMDQFEKEFMSIIDQIRVHYPIHIEYQWFSNFISNSTFS